VLQTVFAGRGTVVTKGTGRDSLPGEEMRYLRASTEAAARMASLLDFDAVLETVITTLVNDFDAARARIWLTDPASHTLYLRADAGSAAPPHDARAEELHYTALPLWLEEVMGSRAPFVADELDRDPRFDQTWVIREGIAAVAAFPLLIAGDLSGIMVLYSRRPFSNEVLDVLASFAAIVTASLNDVQLFVREQEARSDAEAAEKRFAFLAEASRVLAASLEYEITLESVARLVVPHLADWCIVDVLDGDSELRRLTVAHVDPERLSFARALQQRYPPTHDSDQAVLRVLSTGQPMLVREIPEADIARVARDPEHRALLNSLGLRSFMAVPLIAHGRVRGVISFVSAESGRYYDASDLDLAEDLCRRVAIAVDNARLYHELQESIRLRDEFLSTVSHDLKNPLAAIRGRAQMLRRRATKLPAEEAEWFAQGLQSIDASVTRMSRLLGDLVDLARLRMGRPLELERTPIDLVQLIRQVLADHQETLRPRPVRVESAVDRLVGSWDAPRLERVLANLISNAAKYSPPHSEIVVEVKREDRPAGPVALLTVCDRGYGIPANDLSHIFERFHRGANVRGRIEGAGIGLAGAKQIVEQHGGTISAESEEGVGSTFTVELPLALPESK
jgi:signal transduction histidine kinase